eukprot:10579199-Alexandrium_andersonii.AAC.1
MHETTPLVQPQISECSKHVPQELHACHVCAQHSTLASAVWHGWRRTVAWHSGTAAHFGLPWR